jgi:hypothetical protein
MLHGTKIAAFSNQLLYFNSYLIRFELLYVNKHIFLNHDYKSE